MGMLLKQAFLFFKENVFSKLHIAKNSEEFSY